jgi:phage terminase large subunit GpA-like protein
VLYILAVNAAKESIYARLRVDPPGAGALHFPQTHPPEYFEQLTAERVEVTRWRGREIRKWIKPSGRRNEALDCRVYAYAALHGMMASGLRLPAWSAESAPTGAAELSATTTGDGVLAAASTPIDQRPSAAHTVTMPRPAPAPAPAPARRRRGSIYAELRR